MDTILSAQDIKHVKDVANDCMGLRLTDDQARAAFEDKSFASAYFSLGMDTEVKAQLVDSFAMKLLGKKWPTYGHGFEAKELFIGQFDAAARAAGFEVL